MVLNLLLAGLLVAVLLLGAGIIELLRQVRNAIQENYQASLARALTQTDLQVRVQPVVKPCGRKGCGHALADHFPVRTVDEKGSTMGGNCKLCDCPGHLPARGPWPTDPGKM